VIHPAYVSPGRSPTSKKKKFFMAVPIPVRFDEGKQLQTIRGA
jgi:hypothetical protein